MDSLNKAAIDRAQSALKMVARDNAGFEFAAIARSMIQKEDYREALQQYKERGLTLGRPFAQKALIVGNSLNEAWGTEAGRALARNYLASVAERDALTLIERYARTVPVELLRVMVASGVQAGGVDEGAPKAIRHLNLTSESFDQKKSVGVLVMSQELANAGGSEAKQLFEQELATAVTAAANTLVIAQFDPVDVGSTGDAVQDLTAALAAAEHSRGYVVLAATDVCHELAMAADGRMAIDGGEFLPNVHIVCRTEPADSSTPRLTVLPASRVAMIDYGLTVRNASHASVMMSDTPTSPAQMTSLWQTNCVGLMVEREFGLIADAPAVVVS